MTNLTCCQPSAARTRYNWNLMVKKVGFYTFLAYRQRWCVDDEWWKIIPQFQKHDPRLSYVLSVCWLNFDLLPSAVRGNRIGPSPGTANLMCVAKTGCSLYLLSESAVRNGLSSKLNFQRVVARFAWRVHDADGSVAVVNNVNVDSTLNVASNTTCYSTLPSFRRVQVDYTLLPDRNRCTYGVCQTHLWLWVRR